MPIDINLSDAAWWGGSLGSSVYLNAYVVSLRHANADAETSRR
ncbi:MAG: hypothetical protein ACR2H5_12870 [Ktedonobacteraceae bacterium]